MSLMFIQRILLAATMFWVFAGLATAQSDVVGMYLNWQRDPTRTMTVNWVSLYDASPTNVWFRPKEQGGTWKLQRGSRHRVRPSVWQVYRVELVGLEPGTDYEFALGATLPKEDHKGLLFRTMPTVLDRPIRFVTGGDMMHSREMVDAMNRRAGRLDPDFALLGGDLAYANGVDATRWIDWFQSWTRYLRGKEGRLIPLVTAIGNHEVKGGYNGRIPEDAPYFYGFFGLPQNRSYYALDFGRYLSLIILDSDHTQPIIGAQATWLGQALAARVGQQFVFPCYHWPSYGTTKEPKDLLPFEHPRSKAIQSHWIPHFDRFGVSAVFENDHHNFKRTFPLRNNQRNDANGIVYLGDGAWGVGTRTVPPLDKAWYLQKAEPRRHLHHVTLNPTGTIHFQAVEADGTVFDEFTLTRPRTPPMSRNP